jgi:hypothetical protein
MPHPEIGTPFVTVAAMGVNVRKSLSPHGLRRRDN